MDNLLFLFISYNVTVLIVCACITASVPAWLLAVLFLTIEDDLTEIVRTALGWVV